MPQENICEYVFGHMNTLLQSLQQMYRDGSTRGDDTFAPGISFSQTLDDTLSLGQSNNGGSGNIMYFFFFVLFAAFMMMTLFGRTTETQKIAPEGEHYNGNRDDYIR